MGHGDVLAQHLHSQPQLIIELPQKCHLGWRHQGHTQGTQSPLEHTLRVDSYLSFLAVGVLLTYTVCQKYSAAVHARPHVGALGFYTSCRGGLTPLSTTDACPFMHQAAVMFPIPAVSFLAMPLAGQPRPDSARSPASRQGSDACS